MKINGHRPGVSTVNYEHVEHINLVFLLLTLYKYSITEIKNFFNLFNTTVSWL